MIPKKDIVLVGMMGSGKSTIGNILAQKLNYNFIDTDKLIENIEKITIKTIFETKGEKYFRSLEERVILNIPKIEPKVIALGGGSFLSSKVKNHILKKSFSFWLNWKNEILIKRILKNDKRPLIKNLSRKDLNIMIKTRSTHYRNANYKLECDNLSKNEIVSEIIEIYENK